MSNRSSYADPYQQTKRSSADHLALQALQGWLERAYGPKKHLSREQLATSRHDLPFPATLHLDACSQCAKTNIRQAGRWLYPPRAGATGGMIG